MKTVELQWFEVVLGAEVGLRRYAVSRASARRNARPLLSTTAVGTPCPEMWADIIGACGEMAAAKACGVYWDASVGRLHHCPGGDLSPGWHVRTARRAPGRLMIRDDDRDDDVYIAVLALDPWSPTRFSVLGWMTAREARSVGVVEGYNGLDPASFVTADRLHPIEDLIP